MIDGHGNEIQDLEGNEARCAPDQGLKLLRYFGIASGIAIVAILCLVGVGFNRVLESYVIEEAQSNAAHIAAALCDLEGDAFIRTGSDGRQSIPHVQANRKDAIDRRFRRLLTSFNIVKMKIYNAESTIIYSTDAGIIGERDSDNSELADALRGRTISKLEAKEHVWDLAGEKRYDIDLVESYIPILGSRGKTIGCFEIYRDVSGTFQGERRTLARSIGVLLAVLIAVFGALAAFMRRAVRIIQGRTAALYESEVQLRRAFNEVESQKFALDAHAIVSMTDMDGNITYANDNFCEISGYAREEWLGQNHRLIKSSEHPPEFYADLWHTISSGEVWKGEIKNRRKDGTFYWVSATLVPFKDEEGRITQYVAIRTNITERKEADQVAVRHREELERTVRERTTQFAHAKERAEANARIRTDFLVNMSHELRTPLHGILSFADFGTKKSSTAKREKLHEYFSMIRQSGQTLLSLLNNVLDLAKLEAGETRYGFREEDLGQLIDAVATEFRLLAMERNVVIRCVGPDDTVAATLDREKIKQVVRNLLSNAVKYAHSGRAIELGMKKNGLAVRVSVLDEGDGIPEDELDAVFGKFVQSSKTKSGAGGTGLGLAICRQIVSDHGGRIWAENNPGGGAKFVFEIPLKMGTCRP